MKYVLDTNIVAAALNGHSSVIKKLNSVLPGDEAFLPAVALADLRYGALSSRPRILVESNGCSPWCSFFR